jgi:glutaredoxin
MSRPVPHVIVYGRSGCCLCEEALEALARVSERVSFTLEQRDIEADERLLVKYLERIPVIVIDGREAFELIVDETALEGALSDDQFRGNP